MRVSRLIGLDVGSKRIGIAVSDELGILATPRGVLRRQSYNRDAAQIEELVTATHAQRVIVGLPLGSTGSDTGQTRKTRQFADALAARISVPVDLWDESYTTVAALAMGGAGRDDEYAAAIILQSYLDTRRNSEGPAPHPDSRDSIQAGGDSIQADG